MQRLEVCETYPNCIISWLYLQCEISNVSLECFITSKTRELHKSQCSTTWAMTNAWMATEMYLCIELRSKFTFYLLHRWFVLLCGVFKLVCKQQRTFILLYLVYFIFYILSWSFNYLPPRPYRQSSQNCSNS